MCYKIPIYHKLFQYLLWFIDPLGELDKVYRDAYLQNYKDFMVNVKCVSDKQNKKTFNKLQNELNANEEQQKSVFDKRITEWNTYNVGNIIQTVKIYS